jgi:hypothetical protein
MTDRKSFQKHKDLDSPSSQTGTPLENGGEVVVTYLDAPPPAGKKSIHPRPPAPHVPDRKDGE